MKQIILLLFNYICLDETNYILYLIIFVSMKQIILLLFNYICLDETNYIIVI